MMNYDEKLVMRALATGLLAVDAGRRAGWAQTYDLHEALAWAQRGLDGEDGEDDADLSRLARQMQAADELKLHPDDSVRAIAARLAGEWDCSEITARRIILEVKREQEPA